MRNQLKGQFQVRVSSFVHMGALLLLFAGIAACSENDQPRLNQTTATQTSNKPLSGAVRLGEPKKEVKSIQTYCGQQQTAITRSTYSFAPELFIDIIETELTSCAITSKTGTVALIAYEMKPDGSRGVVRWKQVFNGPYSSIGDPRWSASTQVHSPFLVVYTDAEANFGIVYQYLSARSGVRVVTSEPPALLLMANENKETRLVGIQQKLNMLHFSGMNEPALTIRDSELSCKDLLAIIEYGSDVQQIDHAYLFKTQKDGDWKVLHNEDSSRWLTGTDTVESNAKSVTIKGSISNVHGLVAEFQLFNLSNYKDGQRTLKVPISKDRLDVERATLPPDFRLSRDCKN